MSSPGKSTALVYGGSMEDLAIRFAFPDGGGDKSGLLLRQKILPFFKFDVSKPLVASCDRLSCLCPETFDTPRSYLLDV